MYESILNRLNVGKECNNDERTVEPLKSKEIGKNEYDDSIAVSNPCYGNLRIIGTQNNRKENCQIVVCLDISD